MLPLEDECFPAIFSFPGVLSRFYMVWADSRAHPVNSYAECVRTIKKKGPPEILLLIDFYSQENFAQSEN